MQDKYSFISKITSSVDPNGHISVHKKKEYTRGLWAQHQVFKCAPLKTEVKYKNHKNYTRILAVFFNVKVPYIW